MAYNPPFSLQLTEEEKQAILTFIPTQPSTIRNLDCTYHESKIARVLQVAPYLSRIEAWGIAMYLVPTEYYTNINKALYGTLTDPNEIDKYTLIARAATIALVKMSPVTLAYLKTLPQGDGTPTTGLLKRYKDMSVSRSLRYQIGEIITEPAFFSTTYWQLPFGIVQRYAETANTVFEVNITPNVNGSLGRYVDPLKRVHREGEILFPPGIQFVVRARYEANSMTIDGVERAVTVIELEEN